MSSARRGPLTAQPDRAEGGGAVTTAQRGNKRDGPGPGRGSGVAWFATLWVVVVVACGGDSSPGRDAGAEPGDSPVAEPADGPSARPDSSVGAVSGDTVEPGTYAFTCPDGTVFGVELGRDTAIVEVGIRSDTLSRVPGTEVRYEGDDVVFRSRGSGATLTVGANEHSGCDGAAASSSWEKARLLGIEFRALGQEPGWILDIHPARWIRYIGDYGETRLLMPPVDPVRDSAGTRTYRAETASHTLTAVIREEPCRDAMSGRPFSHTVTITVNGQELSGCGRRLGDG